MHTIIFSNHWKSDKHTRLFLLIAESIVSTLKAPAESRIIQPLQRTCYYFLNKLEAIRLPWSTLLLLLFIFLPPVKNETPYACLTSCKINTKILFK